MSVFGNLFGRQYETALDIENITVEDILRIPPNKISTTKIMAEEDWCKTIDPTKQAAVKYIAEQKRMRDKRGFPYPTPDEMVRYFNKRQANKEEVDDLLMGARVENLSDNTARRENLHNYTIAMNLEKGLQSPPPRKGGKKRSRKQRKQRRRKTRRSV
jgi:hypothetical protein